MAPAAANHKFVDSDKVLDAVRAFRKVRELELKQKDKKSIVDDDERQERFVQMQLTVKKMSACQKIIMVPYQFPNCLIGEEDEVCFIVGCRDSDKGNKRADHERYANEWKQKLRSMGIDRDIHVLPVMQLETEFKSFEARRKLCKAFDHFICDHRIMFKMPKLLGTLFFRRRKMPIRVYMKDESLIAQNIEAALTKTLIHISPEGPNVSFRVGNLADHTNEQIAENIRSILDSFIPEQLPGGEANINSIHLASFVGKSVPLYVSLASANSVDMTEADRKFIEKQTPKEVEDEIDTMPGVRVRVRSDGKVTAVKDDSQPLDTDDVLDDDYLDVFRDQEFEERDESKKRYMKHLARKAALRKVGKRFGPNMLKLPAQANVPKPPATKPLPKQLKKPGDAVAAAAAVGRPKPPPVPAAVLDALQGFDEDDDFPPQLVESKKDSKKTPKKSMGGEFEVSKSSPAAGGKASSKAANLSGFNTSKIDSTPAVAGKKDKKAARKSDFVVEKQSAKKKSSKVNSVYSPGMVVSRMSASGDKSPAVAATPVKAGRQQQKKRSDEDTPRPILKTPHDHLGAKEKRKSVTFDFTPPPPGGLQTPNDTEPTPVYAADTPAGSAQKLAGMKRKRVTGGFDTPGTPLHLAQATGTGKKAKKAK